MNENVLLVGNSARGHAIAEAIIRSKPTPVLFAYMKANNPGIAALADKVQIGGYDDLKKITGFARSQGASLAVIDSEEPLKNGVADALEIARIPVVGPGQLETQLETSKAFTRELMKQYNVAGSPKSKTFRTMDGIEEYLKENMPCVLKPDGLTGGKGVMVQGEHFNTVDEALGICLDILTHRPTVVIEEKLEGEEFSLQCFCSGLIVVPMPPVQDHKRRLIGDQGLNTGSMGSYSCPDHLLPFLTQDDLNQAVDILEQIVLVLYLETGGYYRGIIYGGFMLTAPGLKLLEINARFGDPEAINVLSLLETDFLDICRSITCPRNYGKLNQLDIRFKPLATVVKYVVPVNYGLPKNQYVQTASDVIQLDNPGEARLYYSSVASKRTVIRLTSSRAVAVLGTGSDLAEAERIAEQGTRAVIGAVDHRSDIGTAALIAKRVRHMEKLKKTK